MMNLIDTVSVVRRLKEAGCLDIPALLESHGSYATNVESIEVEQYAQLHKDSPTLFREPFEKHLAELGLKMSFDEYKKLNEDCYLFNYFTNSGWLSLAEYLKAQADFTEAEANYC